MFENYRSKIFKVENKVFIFQVKPDSGMTVHFSGRDYNGYFSASKMRFLWKKLKNVDSVKSIVFVLIVYFLSWIFGYKRGSNI